MTSNRADGAAAVVVLCTNLDGPALAASLEKELDIAVLDSVAVKLWRTMTLAGADPRVLSRVLSRWGRVFRASAREN
jgi:maleate isomerase